MKKGDVGLLFIHGIVGNSKIFRFIIDSLPPDYGAVCLTLQGHSGDALAFSRASMKGWQKQVQEAATQMRDNYNKVIVVAHSMGCLLALESAVRPFVDAYVLLNPPLKLRIRARMIINSVKVALGLTANDEKAKAAEEAYGISLDKNPLHYFGWPARYMEWFAKMRATRKMLEESSVESPVEVFLAAQDEMVSTRSADSFQDQSRCCVTLLPSSGHYYFSEPDHRTICQKLHLLLQQLH